MMEIQIWPLKTEEGYQKNQIRNSTAQTIAERRPVNDIVHPHAHYRPDRITISESLAERLICESFYLRPKSMCGL